MPTSNIPFWLLPFANATAAMRKFATESEVMLHRLAGAPAAGEAAVPWATDNRIAFEFPTMCLRAFHDETISGVPIVIEAPFAIHDANIVDLAPGHSLVQTFLRATRRPLYVTHWKSASPDTAAYGIDNYVADLNAAVDMIGGAADLVGICQGGWMALLFAATFPRKVRRLALAGAPVDVSRAESAITAATRMTPRPWIDALIASRGGVAPTGEIFAQLIAECAAPSAARAALQIDDAETPGSAVAIERFLAWNERALDLPGVYFGQTVDWLFRENRLALGTFPVFGGQAASRNVKSPLFVLAADRDEFAPAPQALAALEIVGTAKAKVRSRLVPDCGHLDLFLGSRSLRDEWPEVIRFLDARKL